MTYVNNMGGTVFQKCNVLPKKIWDLCDENGCWISGEHIQDV